MMCGAKGGLVFSPEYFICQIGLRGENWRAERNPWPSSFRHESKTPTGGSLKFILGLRRMPQIKRILLFRLIRHLRQIRS
jgi:hypothetical protein